MSREMPMGAIGSAAAGATVDASVHDGEVGACAKTVHAKAAASAGQGYFSQPLGGLRKRGLDIILSVSLLFFLTPALLVIAILIRAKSRDEAIFRQNRVGFDGRIFTIWKFRTMTVKENESVVQAQRGDKRITRFGKFLRRTSLDELPQLINVLRGDMSLVGPRPHAIDHDIDFTERNAKYAERRVARPGITGRAQIGGARGPINSDGDLELRVELDLQYVRNWSFGADIAILFDTARALFKRDGAF